VEVVLVIVLGVLDVAELEPMSVPAALPVAAVPEAPIEVPLPVVAPGVLPVAMPLAVVVSVLPVAPVDGIVALPLAVVSVDVDGGTVVLDVDDVDEVSVASCLPQADRVRAAIRARAAHCARGVAFIRNSLWVSFRVSKTQKRGGVIRCLPTILGRHRNRRVIRQCRRV
jgi:hypothetical protein